MRRNKSEGIDNSFEEIAYNKTLIWEVKNINTVSRVSKLVLFLFLFCFSSTYASPLSLENIDVAKVSPEKAHWVGQTVTFLLPRLYERGGYVYLYEELNKPGAIHDQFLLAKKIAGQRYSVQGLFRDSSSSPKYYWKLFNVLDNSVLWVRDVNFNSSQIPFMLPEELNKDNKAKEELRSLIAKTVWYNKNSTALGKEISHLEPMTVVDIRNFGEYGEFFEVTLKLRDGKETKWVTSYKEVPPVYSYASLGKALSECFYIADPFISHPQWTSDDWALLISQEIKVGWAKNKVMMSWGRPYKNKIEPKNKAYTERWIYEDNTNLFFKGNTLVKILIAPEKPVEAKIMEKNKIQEQKDKTVDKFKDYIDVTRHRKKA